MTTNINIKQIESIIKKVRAKYRKDDRYKALVDTSPEIELTESKGKVTLERIVFEYYNKIEADSHGITYTPEYGREEVLESYRDWDDLLGSSDKDSKVYVLMEKESPSSCTYDIMGVVENKRKATKWAEQSEYRMYRETNKLGN